MDDVRKVYEKRDSWQILDCREPYEWEAGRIEGAIHVPLADVLAGREAAQLTTSTRVVVVCRSGNRSELATQMLRARGYDAHNLEGGMQAWETAGLPFLDSAGGPGHVA